jgi:hypothetical protein
MRLIIGLVLGGLIGFGIALWFQGEPPFAGGLSGSRGDVAIVLRDSYLTHLAGPLIAGRSGGLLSDVTITSVDGDVAYVRAVARGPRVSVPGGVSLSLRVSNGGLGLDVRSAHIGPIPVPGVVVSPLLTTIRSRVNDLVANSGYVITGAGTTDTGIEIFLKPS